MVCLSNFVSKTDDKKAEVTISNVFIVFKLLKKENEANNSVGRTLQNTPDLLHEKVCKDSNALQMNFILSTTAVELYKGQLRKTHIHRKIAAINKID